MNKLKFYYTFFLCLISLLCLRANLSAQNIDPFARINGQSKILHYTKADYHKEAQFWSMAEDDDGIIYFGTNNGILIFDGSSWSHISLPNNSSVHSVTRADDNKIYIGGYNEFGTIQRDAYGKFYYESLMGLLSPADHNINEVWQILPFGDMVVLRSFDALIIISEGKAVIMPTQNRYRYMSAVKGVLYVVDETGIYILDPYSLKFELLVKGIEYGSEEIISILPAEVNLNLILFTRQGNSYILDPKSARITFDKHHLIPGIGDQIFSAIKTKDDLYYLGTINSQLIIYDYKNKLVSYRNDLQDKTVLSIYESRNGDIWTLLNNGVDCIELSFPGKVIFQGASVYDAKRLGDQFFIATNQGVYQSSFGKSGLLSTKDFKLIEGLEAQAWSLSVLENKVLVGHDKGVFVIDQNETYHVAGTNGIWKIISLRDRSDIFLACNYNGFDVLKINGSGKFVFSHRIENFDISTRDVLQAEQEGVFWVCHGYLGAFKISINDDFTRVISKEHFTEKNGLPSRYSINVTEYNDKITFLSKSGVYRYDNATNQFSPQNQINNIFKDDLIITKLLRHGDKTWFVQNNQLGYFLEGSSILQKSLFASLNGSFITSMEYVEPIDNTKVLVGNNEGLYLYLTNTELDSMKVPTLINSISYRDSKDSVHYVNLENEDLVSLPYDMSSLTFFYSAPLLSPKDGIQFSYKLDNFDNHWSEWESASSREYSFLPHGNYTFRVQAKSLLDQSTEDATFRIEILPIWYRTPLAYAIILVMVILFLILLAFWVRKKLKTTREEEAKLRKVLELELQHVSLEREKELIMIDNEKLEEDIVNKSKEIANYTMLLVKKHDVLAEIIKELNEIKKYAKLDKTKNSIRHITKKISHNLQDEEHLKVFDTNFERVHHDFFNELKAKYPDLLQKELRLCGLVKMNMTNKEIASILNISVRGIETARYRLKKRLSIDQDVNIVEFLEKLSSGADLEQDEDRNDLPYNDF